MTSVEFRFIGVNFSGRFLLIFSCQPGPCCPLFEPNFHVGTHVHVDASSLNDMKEKIGRSLCDIGSIESISLCRHGRLIHCINLAVDSRDAQLGYMELGLMHR